MFSLTKKTDYAIIALTYLAKKNGDKCTAREIAEHFNMSAALVMNVLKVLNQGNLVRSSRGAKGGYSLAQQPEQISLSDIITAVEGPMRVVECAAGVKSETANCGLSQSCPVTRQVNMVHDKFNGFLKEVTLAEIAFKSESGDDNRECLRAGNGMKTEQSQ